MAILKISCVNKVLIHFTIENDFANYLKESCWCSDKHFSFKYFTKHASVSKIISKLSDCFWPYVHLWAYCV